MMRYCMYYRGAPRGLKRANKGRIYLYLSDGVIGRVA